MVRLAQVVAALDGLYDPEWAEPWDAVGLVCGDPDAEVRRVLFAVDPVAGTAEEAIRRDADLLVCHHPLLLRPVHGVAATTYKGRLLHQLVTAGVALFVAHTNADVARPGVSDALAHRLGLRAGPPLRRRATATDKLVTFVPATAVEAVVDALSAAGAGIIGDYRRCAWWTDGTGTFLAGENTSPAVGSPGAVTRVAEARVEMVLPRARRAAVLSALRAAHPYEEPAYDVIELADGAAEQGDQGLGLGRLGELSRPTTLREFARRAAAALPRTPAGLRVAGDLDATVRTVAVCGGAGDDLLAEASSAGAEVFLTADLRHHPAAEHLAGGGPALIDAGHWATEWPWLADAADRLRAALAGLSATVEVTVSSQVTDPWTAVAGDVAALPTEETA